MPVRPIVSYDSLGARIETLLLWLAGFILRPYAFRGIGTISRYFGKGIFNPRNHVIVPIFKQSKFCVYLADYYWSRVLFSDFNYEPEVARVLNAYLRADCVFLDLGAKMGYWSIYASEKIPDPSRILAVEAGVNTFDRLRENATINGSPFTVIHAAVSEQAGQTVSFVTEVGHAGARITEETEKFAGHRALETVATTNVDALVDGLDLAATDRVVIKLDVEGAEVTALKGAANTLRRDDLILIYEDHGADAVCMVSRFVINELGFHVYMVKEHGPAKRASLEEIASSKVNPLTGYNFIAVPPGKGVSLDME